MGYAQEVATWRRGKDEMLKRAPDSPIPDHERARFVGLKYFAPDEKYRIPARLHRHENPVVITMATSKGTRQNFLKFGYFEFEFEGRKVRLEAYRSADRVDEHLFMPFKDGTSGKESYGAARYMDLPINTSDEYILDFNFAYNPYCAYSEDYVCPIPPKENWIGIEVRAGEKKYHY